MKLIVERTHLLAAFKAVAHLADAKSKIPALQHLRLRTEGAKLYIAATDQGSWAEAEIAAEVERQGACLLPAAAMQRMVQNFAEGAQVSIDASGSLAIIRAGRSRYQAPMLPPADFPEGFAPMGQVASFTLMPEEVKRLFEITRPAAPKGVADKVYLEGVYLHTSDDDTTLWGVAADGHVVLAADAPAPDGAAGLPKKVEYDEESQRQQARGLMVPLESVAHLIRMGDAGLEISAGQNILAARSLGALKVSYATRLIENRFPPYERVVPPTEGAFVTVSGGEFSAAVSRLAGMAADGKDRAVILEWTEDGELTLELEYAPGAIDGRETVEVHAHEGAATFPLNIAYLARAMTACGGGRIEIYAGNGKPVSRFRNLDDDGIIACVAQLTRAARTPNTEDAA